MNRPIALVFATAISLAACTPQIVDKQHCDAPGDCLDGYSCVEGTCVATRTCVPKTCETAQAECGEVSDGCGTTVSCGGCQDGYSCVEGECKCAPKTCETARAECGEISDGCGATIDCGDSCTAPLQCGTDGRANRCGFVAEGWAVETVCENCGGVPDLAIDREGRAFVSLIYTSGGEPGLWLYESTAFGWISERIGLAHFVASASCAVDSLGDPYVVNGLSTDLYFNYRTAEGWQTAGVSSGDQTSIAVAIDLTFEGELPHLCAVRGSVTGAPVEDGLQYATYREESGWTSEVVPLGDGVLPFGCNIAVDSAHRVHVVVGDAASKGMLYAVKDAGTWTVGPILPGEASYRYFSMALDDQESPVVSFHHSADSTVRVATLRDGVWDSEIVDTVASYAAFSSIAVDASGKVHVSYYQPKEAGYLKYATNLSGTWAAQSVAVGGALVLDEWGNGYWSPQGGFNSLVLDPAGKPRIVFFDSAAGQMRFAKKL